MPINSDELQVIVVNTIDSDASDEGECNFEHEEDVYKKIKPLRREALADGGVPKEANLHLHNYRCTRQVSVSGLSQLTCIFANITVDHVAHAEPVNRDSDLCKGGGSRTRG